MFCFNCGEKVIEGAKFCSNCGTKLAVATANLSSANEELTPLTHKEQVEEQKIVKNQETNENNVTEQMVETIFAEAFKGGNKFGNLVYIIGKDPITQELEENMHEYYLSDDPAEKPMLLFDYGNKKLAEGLVVSNQRLVWNFATTGQQEIELSDVKDVFMGKAILATVLNVISCDNIKYKSIYLTGIQEEAEFAVKFRKFVSGIYLAYHGNEQEKIMDCGKRSMESNTDFIVRACNSVNIDSMYCEIGHPTIFASSSKYDKAKMNFNIPDSEDIFLIFDATVLGSCQKGFAVCTTGLYYGGHRRGYISWEQYKDVPISNGFAEIKVGYESFNTGSDGKKLFMILRSIQECL